MKARPIIRSVTLMSLIALLCIGTMTGYAQQGNLLTNPGFEPPYNTLDGEPPRQVAQGWMPWHVPAAPGMSLSENVQPEYYPATDTTNGLGVPRILSGTEAQQYFTFFATHTGGVYQRVTGITPGAQLRFSVNAYIWSSSFDDVDVSEDDGGVVVQVGIDPTGGTDGQSGSIVWSAPVAQQYDQYDLYSVTATAAGNAVTVFVRSTVSFPVKNNNIYLDDASLTVVGGQQPPTNTLVPPTATFTTAPQQPTATPTVTTQPPTAGPPTEVPPTQETLPTDTETTEPSPETLTPTSIPPTTAPVTPTPSPTVDRITFPGTIVHVVERGDTVARLASLYGSSIQAIISANGLNSTGLIFVGQALLIPVRLAPPMTATPLPPGVTLTPRPPTATSVPLVTATFVPPPPPPSGQPGVTTYVIQPGDTLSGLAVRFNTTVAALAQLNGIVNPNLIFAGFRIRVPDSGVPPLPTAIVLPTLPPGARPAPPPTVPAPRLYLVQPGDNLYRISLQFGVPLQRLIQFNAILDPNRIYVGQIIVIP